MSEKESAGGLGGFFTAFFRGLLKLVLATLIISIVNSINVNTTLTIGGNTYDLSVLWIVIKFVLPFALILSALHDMGIRL